MADDITRIVLNMDANVNQINKKMAKLTGDSERQFKKISFNASSFERKFQKSMREAATAVSVVHGPLGGVASRLTAFGSIIGNTGVAVGGFIGVTSALSFAMVKAVRLFDQFERQQLTTEAVLKATGHAAGKSAEDIEDLAQSIALATLASRQEARAAATQLLTFKSVAGDTFDRTLRLAQDLAASGFGTLTTSTVQLGKALEDPEQGLTALRRVGVSFSSQQRKIIRNFVDTGRVAEAQNEILKAVEEQVGGAGAAGGAGLAGAYDTLTEQTGILLERWGKQITEGTRLKDILQDIAGVLEEVNAAADFDLGPLDKLLLKMQGVDFSDAKAFGQSGYMKALNAIGTEQAAAPDTSEEESAALREFIQLEKERAHRTRDQIKIDSEAKEIQKRAKEEGIFLTKEQAVNQANLNAMIADQVDAHEKFAQVRMAVHDQIRQKQLEAEMLMAVAGSAMHYAQAISYAEQKARLFAEAERAGVEITPIMRDEIDRLAMSYAESGKAAEDAVKQIEDNAKFSQGVVSTLKGGFSDLFNAIVDGGKSAGDVIGDLGKKLAAMAAQEAAFRFLGAAFPSLFGAGGFVPLKAAADGDVFGGKGINSYSGKIVNKPTVFPFADGAGIMGEAGDEAVLPLTRIGGKLGVRAVGGGGGGGGTVVNIINQAPVEIETRKSRSSSGREVNDIIIREANKGMAQGRMDKSMSRFGGRPRPVKRG